MAFLTSSTSPPKGAMRALSGRLGSPRGILCRRSRPGSARRPRLCRRRLARGVVSMGRLGVWAVAESASLTRRTSWRSTDDGRRRRSGCRAAGLQGVGFAGWLCGLRRRHFSTLIRSCALSSPLVLPRFPPPLRAASLRPLLACALVSWLPPSLCLPLSALSVCIVLSPLCWCLLT